MTRTRLRGLEIAGIQIGIEVPPNCLWQWPDGAIAEHSCLPRDPDVHVGVRVGQVGSGELGGECYALGAWTFEVARSGEDWILGLSRGGRREQLAFFDRDFRAGEIVLSFEGNQRPGYPLRTPLDEWIVLQRTVARGGLCLTGSAFGYQGQATIQLGSRGPGVANRWTTPATTLLGRNTLWVREEAGSLRLFQTPWGEVTDSQLGAQARVHDINFTEDAPHAYRERLDPGEAAELLVNHAVVPLCDERLLERVLRNAQRIGEVACISRIGENMQSPAPIAWQSPQLQSGLARPRGMA